MTNGRWALKTAAEQERMTFDWGELHWYAGAPGGNSDHQTVGRCILRPGAANPKHYHHNCEEILYVLDGTIEHFVDGQGWITMRTGDTITIAANVWHHARNVGSADAHLLICFSSPNRETIGE